LKLSKTALMGLLMVVLLGVAGCSSGEEAAQGNDSAPVAGDETIALPEETPALIGRVKEIIGNEVTVYKMQLPSQDGRPTRQEGTQNPPNQPDQQDQADQSNQAQGNRPAMTEATGETETLIIPVGTPIVTVDRSTNETTSVELTEIKADQILRVWMEDDTVQFVQVMVMNANRTQSQDRERQGGDGPPDGMGGPPPGMGG
jgi:hypothetical protein